MTVLKYLEQHALEKPGEDYLVDRRNGEDIAYSFEYVQRIVESLSRSLAALFPDEPRKVSILSKNRAHWSMCDLGVLRSGNILAPVFTTMPTATFKYAMAFADIQLLFVGEASNWDTVKGEIPTTVEIVSLPGLEIEEADYTFEEFLALGADTPLPEHPDPDTPCTIVFTSGTTGMPKGVLHSLNTLNAFVSAVCDFAGPQTRFFSYLPLAHLGDRAATVFHATQVGGRLTFNESVDTFTADMEAAAPTFLMGVPRIWEKLLQGVLVKIGIDSQVLQEKLAEPGGEELARQIRADLGLQNVNFLVAATAPTSNAIKEWYARLGMPLHDVYGQTELCPLTCSPGASDGSVGVGPACGGFEVKIAESGEILGRGPALALGYYNNPEKTAETFVNGWVHTGDKGWFDERGNLHITGRVQDTFKTSKGKYVAPVPIENSFSRSALVEQQCLYGFGLTQPIMLCTLSETAPADQDIVEEKLATFAGDINEKLEPHERIAGIVICKTPWSVESGVLTHTLKVKRESVAEKYEVAIRTMAESIAGNDRGVKALWWQ
jgi:long-subunit acyl-CoA synthetase (AMP-forming)